MATTGKKATLLSVKKAEDGRTISVTAPGFGGFTVNVARYPAGVREWLAHYGATVVFQREAADSDTPAEAMRGARQRHEAFTNGETTTKRGGPTIDWDLLQHALVIALPTMGSPTCPAGKPWTLESVANRLVGKPAIEILDWQNKPRVAAEMARIRLERAEAMVTASATSEDVATF